MTRNNFILTMLFASLCNISSARTLKVATGSRRDAPVEIPASEGQSKKLNGNAFASLLLNQVPGLGLAFDPVIKNIPLPSFAPPSPPEIPLIVASENDAEDDKYNEDQNSRKISEKPTEANGYHYSSRRNNVKYEQPYKAVYHDLNCETSYNNNY